MKLVNSGLKGPIVKIDGTQIIYQDGSFDAIVRPTRDGGLRLVEQLGKAPTFADLVEETRRRRQTTE